MYWIKTLFLLLLATSCVRPKIYRAELSSREKCEAREAVLVKEVLARRDEQKFLSEKIGELNRQLGNQDAEIEDLKGELTRRTIQMGESSSKLASEKTELEQDLRNTQVALDRANAKLAELRRVQTDNAARLNGLRNRLTDLFPAAGGATVLVRNQSVLLILQDQQLFDANGQSISESGKASLRQLAVVLGEDPTLKASVESHTDSKLPRDKNIKDTWDWSLIRASNVIRFMVSEYNANANQLTPVGKGEFFPISSNETEEGRARNRRTEFILTPSLESIPVFD